MFDDVDQHHATIRADGSLIIPATLLEALGWEPGMKLLLEETDEGVLLTAAE